MLTLLVTLLTASIAQIYLPSSKECTVFFMQQLMSGRKKVSQPMSLPVSLTGMPL